jgi:hypothetical protein
LAFVRYKRIAKIKEDFGSFIIYCCIVASRRWRILIEICQREELAIYFKGAGVVGNIGA